ncbi:MAG TPA: hypothetical protein VN909_01690 [Candidatus Dormibacteraeota bacterium]|nr:hypothetical protein [Candidatus Dormibacteraeota bacterium]
MNKRVSVSVLIFAVVLSACGTPSSAGMPASTAQNGATQTTRSTYKIFVANIGDGMITAYKPDGTETAPTINTGNYLYSIAIAPNGKIYAVTFDPLNGPNSNATIASYKPDGGATTPTVTIKERGYHVPVGIAVDRSGKIYVLSAAHNGKRGTVTTYAADGKRTTPTFLTGADSSAIAIDASGKIYVANDTGPGSKSSVTTYLPDGSPATPTITRGIHRPDAIAIGADGTIYVANTNSRGHDGTGAGFVTRYTSDGAGPLQTTKDREAPGGIAEANGNIYLGSSSAYRSTLKTYTAGGKRISPTITSGLDEPSAIAIY